MRFLIGCANPVTRSLIPAYVDNRFLLRANGITETVTQGIQTAMWFIGSSLLIWLAADELLWLTAGLFLLSSMLLSLLEPADIQPAKQQGKWQQITKGWQTVSSTPVLKRLAWMDVLETIADTVWIAEILYVFVSDALMTDEKWWGLIGGSLLCLRFAESIEKNLGTFIFAGAFLSSVVTMLFGMNSVPLLALVLSFLVGIFGQLRNIPQQTVIQTSVPREGLPTVFTTLGAIGTGTFGLASLLMGVLADAFGIRTVFMIAGLLLSAASLIAFKGRVFFWKTVQE